MLALKIPLYIHIPFCRRKCYYCDFYSVDYQEELARSYIDTLLNQIKGLKDKGYDFSTVYIGGGTPSVLSRRLIEKLLKSLDLFKNQEVSFEANPDSLDKEKLKLLLDWGVNRLSIGVQSFQDRALEFLGRLHNFKEAVKAINLAKKLGFDNISIDLIYGIPSQTIKIWEKELSFAIKLPLKHISLYSLTYEEGTPLFSRLKNKEFEPLSSEIEAQLYRYAVDFLGERGFSRYEVSNFSKRGYECKHNFVYWANSPYLGLGPGAVSYLGGVRKKYIPNIYNYIKGVKEGKEDSIFVEEESLSSLKRARETAILNLRRRRGLNFKEFKEVCGFEFLDIEGESLRKLLEERLLTFKRKNSQVYGVRLTKRGFLFYDYVCRELL